MLQLFNVRNWHTLLFINATNLKLTVSAQKISLYFHRELPWKNTIKQELEILTIAHGYCSSATLLILPIACIRITLMEPWKSKLVPTAGIEPATYWLQVSRTTNCAKSAFGRNDRIWTCAPLFPKQVLYQAKLHSEILAGILGFEPRKCQIQSLVPYHLATSQQKHGGLGRTRTFDRTVNSRLLYQLSYESMKAKPTLCTLRPVMPVIGF